MKKHLSLLTLLIVTLCFASSCRKASGPGACIAAFPDTVLVEQPVTFYSCTKGATSYRWNFGDGSTASTDTATHIYTTPGTYQGSLTTSNGQNSNKAFTIVVANNPAGYFSIGGSTFFPGVCDSAYPGIIAAAVGQNRVDISVGFYQEAFPTSSGAYTPVYSYVSGLQPGQVDVSFAIDTGSASDIYLSSGSNAPNSVHVTVLPNHHLNISGSNIEMIRFNNPSDSFPLTFNITQTQ